MCSDTLCIRTGASKRCVLQWCVASLLCLATQSLHIAVEWLRQGFSLLRVRAEYYCVFAAESRISSYNGNMKDAKGALAAIFSSFWR